MDKSIKEDTATCRRQAYSNKEYAEELRKWISASSCWQFTMLHYSYAAYQAAAAQHTISSHIWNVAGNTVLNDSRDSSNNLADGSQVQRVNNPNVLPQQLTLRFRVPAVWKRFCAEVIDFIILMTIRMCVLAVYIKAFNLDNALAKLLSNLSISELAGHFMRVQRAAQFRMPNRMATARAANAEWNMFGEPAAADGDDDILGDDIRRSLKEVEDFLLISPVYLLLELTNTFIVTAYETVFTMREWRRGAGACTPGKRLMGLRLVRAADMLELPDAPDGGLLGSPGLLVEVNADAARIGFITALCRATMKNFSQTFLFPLSLTGLLTRNHRTAYDMVANVIVVESL